MNYTNLLIHPFSSNGPTDKEISDALRAHRTILLNACDWTQLPDVDPAKVDVAAWRTYRQELRDMMAQSEDPKLIVFPEPPK